LLHPERLFVLNEDKWVQIQAPTLAKQSRVVHHSKIGCRCRKIAPGDEHETDHERQRGGEPRVLDVSYYRKLIDQLRKVD
jgi:hypothetical protein